MTIERMRVEDFIWYHARFDDGSTTDGQFGEDGRTVFTHSRAAGVVVTQMDGKAAIKPGGRAIKVDASKFKPTR